MIPVIMLGVVCFIVGWLAKTYEVERAEWRAYEQHCAEFDREHGVGSAP